MEANGEQDKAVFILEENGFNHGVSMFMFVIIAGLVAEANFCGRSGNLA
jgi:hypothetical protein